MKIMETIQEYVPIHSETSTVEISGVGEKRARGSKHVRSNSSRD